ncbi:MAG: hypothetical protein ACKOZW_11045 [Cyanobium sp.]
MALGHELSWHDQFTTPFLVWIRPCFCHALPETVAIVAAVTLKLSAPEALLLPTLVRLAWLLAELGHGAAHTLVRALVDGDASLIRPTDLLENRRFGPMVAALRPFASLPLLPGARDGQARLATGDATPWKVRLKAAAPLALHAAVVVMAAWALQAMGMALNHSGGVLRWAAAPLGSLLLANLWLMLLSRSDWQMLAAGQGRWLYCGNFGLLAASDHPLRGDLISDRTIGIFQRMGQETELRGAQAGGGLVMALDQGGDTGFVGTKIVNAKRGDLTPALESAFRQGRRRARRRGWQRHPAGLMACWHYRFGTSGPPAVRETHWQEWSPARRARIWQRRADGLWHWQWQTVHHRITHNGDFEAYDAFGTSIAVGSQLGPWLEEALQQPAPAVVDSARIAAMMDLLICRGDWYAAVRWGYLNSVAPYPATPNTAALAQWASWFEEAFAAYCQDDDHTMAAALVERLLPKLRGDGPLLDQPVHLLQTWIEASLTSFLENDPATATRQFMDHARGSFGLVVISTTWPDRLVLCSLGQPLTVGLHPREGLAIYASEPAAVDAVLSNEPGSWRCDLDDNAGEIAILSHNIFDCFSLSLNRSLTPEEQQARALCYGTSTRLQVPLSPRRRRRESPDPVEADIASIPSLLAAIHDDWSNPGSANRQSAEVLAQLFIAKAANLAAKEKLLRSTGLDESLSRSSHVDLLITGVENSLWLGEQFG